MTTHSELIYRRERAKSILFGLKELETDELDGLDGDRLFDALTREGVPSTICEMVTVSEASHRRAAEAAIEEAKAAMARLVKALSEGVRAIDKSNGSA